MPRPSRALTLQLLFLAAGLGLAFWAYHTFPVLHYLTAARERVALLGMWGLLGYPLAYAACNILLVPAGALAIGSGLIFGLWKGFVLNSIGNTLSTAGCFGISRALGRDRFRRRFLRHPQWAALDLAVAREGWKIIFLSHVIPFAPCSLLSYLFGISRIQLRTVLLWTALGQAPTMFLYAYIGTLAQRGIHFLEMGRSPTTAETMTWVGGGAVAIVAIVALARLSHRLLDEAKAKALREVANGTLPAGRRGDPIPQEVF